jgi:hopanoid-associated phosphorylase
VKPTSDSKPVLVITGAAFEARIAAGDDVSAVCSGGYPARLRTLLETVDSRRFRAVISFGLAGGLDPALRPGDLIVASHVISNDETRHATLTLGGALATTLHAHGVSLQSLAGVDAPVMTPEDKAALRTATGAAAVDMETHVAARFAADHRLPWGALRVVCDPAQRGLPPLAMEALKPDGGISIPAVLKSLVSDPSQISALIATGRDTAAATRSLRRARRLLGPGFGLIGADFG